MLPIPKHWSSTPYPYNQKVTWLWLVTKRKWQKLKIKKKKWQLQWQNKTYEVLHAEQSFTGSKKAKEMTGLDKKQGGQLVLLLTKVISAFCVSKMPNGAMDFLWGEYLLGFRREQLKISPSVTEGTREP